MRHFDTRRKNDGREARLSRAAALSILVLAARAEASQNGDVFYIDMENHNFTQPSGQTSPQQLLGNPAAPYQNSLITPGNPNAAQTSWASKYTNVAAGVHPSLPNYLWQEQGTNNGVLNDNTPFGTGGASQGNNPSLSGLLKSAGISWKSYQEDINLTPSSGSVNQPGVNSLTSTVAPTNQWTVPLNNFSGTSAAYTNPYNGSHQYNFGTKHDGQLYFNATNGGNDTTTSNPLVGNYAPLQQLQTDLTNNTVFRYNLITPDQFNDSHTALTNGFTYNGVHYTGDAAAIAQGDNFLSNIIPTIEASQAYQNNGEIVIWWDETEGGDTSANTLEEIVISPLAKGNAYQGTIPYTHSSDLRTLQNVFGVNQSYLGDAVNASDLSDLYVAGVSNVVPEPTGAALLGLAAIPLLRRRRRS